MFDPIAFKAQFPLFSHPDNKNLVYLDNAATCQKPAAVIEAISQFYCQYNANAHRSSHRLARQSTQLLEQSRQKLAQFIQADSPQSIVFTSGATASLNLLAYSLCQNLDAGDEIILSVAEHHANLVPWQIQAQQKGLRLRFLPLKEARIDTDAIADLISSKTRIISLSAASNVLGDISDLTPIQAICKQHAILLVLDASQLIAHRAIDVKQLQCDFLVASAHKFYGPNAVGFIYAKPDLFNQLPPWQAGGEMISQVSLNNSQYAKAPARFEAGTAALAEIYALSACIDFLNQQDRPAMQAYENELNHYLHQQLDNLPFVQLQSQPHNNVGLASFSTSLSLNSADIADFLDQQEIAVRTGKLCTHPLLEALGQEQLIRISLAAYNQKSDIDRLISALEKLAQHINQPSNNTPYDTMQSLLNASSAQARYKLLLHLAQNIKDKPEIRQECYKVSGCEANLWLKIENKQGLYGFIIDSDSRVIKALSALLLLHIDDKTAEQIKAFDINDLFKQLDLDRYLTASRQNGFARLLEQIKQSLKPD